MSYSAGAIWRKRYLAAPDREAFLRANSRLPGPRSNLELLSAAAEEVDEDSALAWAARKVGDDPTDVFVISVGLVGIGRSLGAGSAGSLSLLRRRAADDEWRVRESVAIALQRLGDDQPQQLASLAREWSMSGNPLEARAAVAAVAEPRLLRSPEAVAAAVNVLDAATALVAASTDRRSESVRVLRQALGYAWSVVVAADPDPVWPRFVALSQSHANDPDVQWIVRENLKKKRLIRLDFRLPEAG